MQVGPNKQNSLCMPRKKEDEFNRILQIKMFITYSKKKIRDDNIYPLPFWSLLFLDGRKPQKLFMLHQKQIGSLKSTVTLRTNLDRISTVFFAKS